MEENKRLGHVTKVEHTNDKKQWWLFHTTACCFEAIYSYYSMWTCFNASCPTNNELSLNSELENDIFGIQLRFGKYKYVIAGDITNMFRQILIDMNKQRYQRICWRAANNNQLECFELNTVTYETAPAPGLAVGCLLQFLKEHSERLLPITSSIIIRNFYLDPILTCANSHSKRSSGYFIPHWF